MTMGAQKIRVCMVGAGGFGHRHAKVWAENGNVEFLAVCGRTQARTQARANEFGIRAYTDTAEMIEQEKPDLVDVVTQEMDQYNAITGILNKGGVRAVFTEKPLGTTIEQAYRMIKLAREKGIDFGVNFNRRYAMPYQYVDKWIREGTVGDLSYITLKFSHDPYDPPSEVDPYRWFFNVYPHGFDMLAHFAGEIRSISAFFTKPANHFYFKRFTINFLFKNGCVANLIGGGEGKWRHQSEYLEAGGTKGQAIAVNVTESAMLRLHDEELEQVWRPAIAEGPGLDFFEESVRNHLNRIAECMVDGLPLPTNASSALYAQIVMQAAKKSHEAGGAPVDIDEFIDSLRYPDMRTLLPR
jgi:myo-inositol 2-dehydrogenase/D-chiro-inositol 1-dehydrogenase